MANMAKLERLAAQSRAKVQSKIPKPSPAAVVRDVDDNASGMSQRAAAMVVGVDESTIRADVRGNPAKSAGQSRTGSAATLVTEDAPPATAPPVEDYEHDVPCPSRMTIGARRVMVFCAREHVWLRVPVCFTCAMGMR